MFLSEIRNKFKILIFEGSKLNNDVGERILVSLPDEFSVVSEAEEKHANINSCHEEYTDARTDAVQAGVGNQQNNRNDIGVQ